MKSSLIYAVCLVALFCVAFATAQSATHEVVTPQGTVRGYLSTDSHAYVYRGIPYVDPYKRWEHSKAFSGKFDTVFDAKEDSPASPQPCHLPPHTCPETFAEFGALTVNIFTPIQITPAAKAPVMVYLHGGNYYQGSGGGPLYNATAMAYTGGAIIVTVNYRLGILGFYRDDALGIWGNYGVVDQLNALKWVKKNIASFGGNPDNVTLFGQSAGAGSTCVHLISQYSNGLFHKAIVHSNPFAIPFRSYKTKPGLNKAFHKHSGCETRECMLNLTADQIVAAQVQTATDLDAAGGNILSVFIPFNPYVETPGQESQDPEYPGLVPYQPQEAFLRGLVKDIPIIMGLVRDEADVFIYQAFTDVASDSTYDIFIWLLFGDEKSKRIKARYPASPGVDNRDNLCTVGTAFIFQCANRNSTLAAINTSVRQPVYSYLFDTIYSFNDQMWGPDFPICKDRVYHAAELPSTFNSVDWMFPMKPDEKALANSMNVYWTNFATTGNPNYGPNKVDVTWEQYRNKASTMRFAKEGNAMIKDYLKEDCDFWDSIGYFL